MTKIKKPSESAPRAENSSSSQDFQTFRANMLRLVFVLLVGVATLPAQAAEQEKKILFLAGPKDHGVPGRHEYEKDLRVLAKGLENATNLDGVRTQVHVGAAPRDLSLFQDAAAIVVLSSSDRAENETHPLFPPDPTTDHRGYDEETAEYLENLNALIKKNRIGVAIFHYANWVENWTARGYVFDWTGGLWVQMVSRNPNDQWHMQPTDTNHPVLRGVDPWTYRDEVFSRFFLPRDERRTDLLIGTPAESEIGPQVAAWAYQRDDGGRGFVMGGVDYHENMQVEDYRRFLLNGIAWTAGLDVPAEGVKSKLRVEP